MSDSVGKIQLELEVIEGNIQKQVGNISGKIKSNITKTLSGLSNIGNIDKMLNNTQNTIRKQIDSIRSKIKNNISELKGYIEGIFSKLKVKNPMKNFLNKENPMDSNDTGTTKTTRGPPTGVNADVIKAQMDNISNSIDITNAKIELQQDKLANLKETYINTFNTERKNKIQEDILKTEASINKLIGESDKAGFKLADLDKQFSNLGNSSKTASDGIDKTTNKITDSAKVATKTSGSLKSLEESSNRTGRSFGNMGNTIASSFKRVLKQVLVIGVIYKAIRGLTSYMNGALQTNNQFANSLAVIKTNLQVAFMPIYQFILPAINALMQGLSVVTTYIASFVSAIFGKTYAQSAKAAKGLNTTKAAMANVGKSAKKTAKEVKEAQGSLMGFDEINTLSKPDKGDDDGVEGAGGLSVPPMVMPAMDTSIIDKSMSALVIRFKKIFDDIFSPFRKAWDKNGAGVTAEFKKAIEGTKETIKSFFDMLGTPEVQKFIETVAKLGLKIGELFLFIYNNYFLPLLNWLIEKTPVITSILAPLFDGISNFIDWLMGEGKPVLDVIVTVLGSMLLAFVLVTGAIKIFNFVAGLIALVTSPMGLVVLAIGAIIAIGILLVKHWDWVKAVANAVWEGIKNIFMRFIGWIDGIFTKDWTKSFGLFGNVLNAFFGSVKGVWDSIKRVFSGIVDFIAGVFTGNWSRAWKGIVDIFGGIFGGIKALALAPINFIIGIVNGLIGGLNKISLPDWVPLIGGKGINIPKIPKLARGGILDQPTLNIAGEAGKEAVIPLENNTQGLDLLADKLMDRLGSSGVQGGSNAPDRPLEIILELGGGQFAKFMIDSINNLQKKEGRVLLQI